MTTDTRDRLYAIFMDRFVQLWRKNLPLYRLDLEDRIDIFQRWKEYVEGVGGRMMDVPEGCDPLYGVAENGVLFIDPCESPDNFYKEKAPRTYILLPNDLAIKILALGALP